MRALAIAVLVAASAAFAAEVASYPWDSRPLKCAHNDVQMDCSARTWPHYGKSWRYLVSLYNAGRYKELEDALDNLQKSPRRFASGRPVAVVIEPALEEMFPPKDPRADEAQRIAGWKAAIPDSRYAPIAQSYALTRAAWRVRGNGFAETVSPESWELFGKRMKQAQSILLGAPAAARDSVLWHSLLLDIEVNVDMQEAAKVFETAVKRWPDYYPLYETLSSRLQPKWGGSWAAVDSFAGYWASRHAEGDALYARIYLRMRNAAAPGVMVVNWPRLKKGLQELAARNTDSFFRNAYASYACAMRDRPAYEDAMRKIGSDLDPREWMRGHGSEACSRWGATDT